LKRYGKMMDFLKKFRMAAKGGAGAWTQSSTYCRPLPLPKVQKNPSRQHKFFSTTPNSILFYFISLNGITLFYFPLKFQKLSHVFEVLRAYPNSQKTHCGTLVL
jgi:hypothetical protein